MDFDEIKDCFPDGGIYETDDGEGITTSAQWLHEFAKNVAAAEREACAKIAEIHEEGPGGAEAIRMRSNGEVKAAPLAGSPAERSGAMLNELLGTGE